MKRMKTAIVGCGVISDVYMQSFKDRFSVIDLLACSDLDEERMASAARKFGIKPMTYDEILADPEVELVVNLTSPGAHYALTKQALERGKHVYSEKMLAVKFHQAVELCSIAKKNHVRLGCAPDTFLGGGLQTARYAMDRNLAGRILSGIISLTRDYRVFGDNLPHLFRSGGSVLFDMGSYYLTAVCSLLGPVKRVSAFGTKTEEVHEVKRLGSPYYGQKIPLEDCNVITAALEFAGGAFVTLHLNSGTVLNETFHLELYGDKGILRLGDPNTFGGQVVLEKAGNQPAALPFTHGFQEQSRGLGAAEMAWSILNDRPHRAGMELACHVLEVVHGIFSSIENGEVYQMTTGFERPAPLPEGYIGKGFWEPEEESALI